MRARWLRGMKVAVTLGLLVWLVITIASRQGVDALWRELDQLELGCLLLAAGFHALAVVVSVIRWRLLLTAAGLPLPFSPLMSTFLTGRFLGAFTPGTTGLDVYRAVDIGRKSGQMARSSNVILIEKSLGLIAMVLLAWVLLVQGLSPHLEGAGLLLLGVGAISVAAVITLCNPSRLGPALRLVPARIRPRLERLVHDLGKLPLSSGRLALVGILGVASHALTAAVFVASAWSLEIGVPAAELFAVGLAIVVATVVPISIGGIGVREGVAVVGLGALGVGPAPATLVALLGYLAMQPPAILGGLFLLSGRRSASPSLVRPPR